MKLGEVGIRKLRRVLVKMKGHLKQKNRNSAERGLCPNYLLIHQINQNGCGRRIRTSTGRLAVRNSLSRIPTRETGGHGCQFHHSTISDRMFYKYTWLQGMWYKLFAVFSATISISCLALKQKIGQTICKISPFNLCVVQPFVVHNFKTKVISYKLQNP